jgi:hypothetical protein
MSDAFRLFLDGLAVGAASPQFAAAAVFAVLAIAAYHWGVARPRFGAVRSRSEPELSADIPDLQALRSRLAAVESRAGRALQHVGFVRFNAFPDVGSELSFALAVIDGRGDGYLVSSIYSREEVRTYAKAVRGFSADKEVSSEERAALGQAQDQAEKRTSS